MNVPKLFWVFLAVFEVAFGSLIFLVTRSYYRDHSLDPVSVSQNASSPLEFPAAGPPIQAAPAIDLSIGRTPEELARLADEHFENRQYDAAATLYENLLEQDRGNVDLLNNLAITVHYLGRSEEALGLINEGIVTDPAHQRIWLTRGFILSQTGRAEAAASALNTAVEIDPASAIADSARTMLSELNLP